MISAPPPILRLEAVCKRFGDVVAADSVSLDVGENEFVALLGPSGCGKTTVLRIMAGLEQSDSGRVVIAGADTSSWPPYARPVNMMFQSYALFPHMTVAANVAFGLKQDRLAGPMLRARVDEALALVELSGMAARKPDQLSGGQQQRVALARCIAKRPKVLLLDEPMAALDKHLRERTQLELMALRRRLGIAFVVVTHDQDEAMAMADRVAVMAAGKILQVGSPRELYERPQARSVAGFFGDINIWDGYVAHDLRSIECPALGLAVAVAAPLASAETAVAVAVRPEQIALSRAGAGGANRMAATVIDVIYRGTASTYLVRTASGAVLRVIRQNSQTMESFVRDDAVVLSWPAEATLVLPP